MIYPTYSELLFSVQRVLLELCTHTGGSRSMPQIQEWQEDSTGWRGPHFALGTEPESGLVSIT